MAKVPDTTKNIEIIMDELKPQIDRLISLYWREKRVKVFFFGDYWFLAKLYGISGPSGFHPCLWCQKDKQKIQTQEAGSAKERSLQCLEENYNNFLLSGSEIKNAKYHFNVIHPPMLDIDIHHVSPPYLHILLGLVVRHHKLLEKDAINIDEEIAEERARLAGEIRTYEKYGQHWEEAMTLKEDKQHLKTCFLLHRKDREKKKENLKKV